MSILRKRGCPSRYLPRLEGLESRRLLAVSYSFYPLNAPDSYLKSIAVGPDNDLWFTIRSNTNAADLAIGQINPSTGALSVYPQAVFPGSIVSGPGGNLWFLGQSGAMGTTISEINPSTHVTTTFAVGIAGVSVNDLLSDALASGPDGNLWFTDVGNGAIGEFNVITHQTTEYPLPKTSQGPRAIVAGPDGNLWFTVGFAQFEEQGILGEINPTTHAINEFRLPTSFAVPTSITSGPDGNLWFNEEVAQYGGPGGPTFHYQIGNINPTTDVVAEFAGGGRDIATGPDGSLWYTGASGGYAIGEINPATHATATYALPDGGGALVTGPDGRLWFAGGVGSIAVATIIPSNQAAVAGYLYLDPTGSGSPYSGNNTKPLYGQTVFLDLKGDDQVDPGDPTASTGSDGYYSFAGLTPGTYTVCVVPYAGTVATSPAGGSQTVTVAGGQLGSPDPLGILPTSSLLPLSFNPTPFGTANPDVQTAEVGGLYRLILGRAPDATGGASAVSYLKNGGSLGQLAADLLHSAEYDTDVVVADYRAYLRRAPDAAGQAAAVAYLQGGGSLDGLAESLMDSAEYGTLFAANATFVQAIYGDILGRLASPSEINAGTALLGTGVGRSSYVAFLIKTPESDTRAVVGAYGIVFARSADPDGQSSAVAALQGGEPPVGLATSLFGSAEFVALANATVK